MINYIYKYLSRRKLKALHRIGNFLGIIAYFLTPSRRSVVEKNCETIGFTPSKQLTKSIYQNIAKSFMEFFYVEQIDESFILNNVECDNDEELFKIFETHDAIFCIGGHLGAWEFNTAILSKYFKSKGATVGRRVKNSKLDELVSRVRSMHGNQYIVHRNAVPKIIEALGNKKSIGVLLDHSATPKNALYIDFFGHKTSFIAGVPVIAVKKNITMVPIFVIRENENYRIIHYPPIVPDKSLKPKERIAKIARDINIVYEDVIPKYKEQWFMLHKRFKRTEGSDGKVTNDFYR